MRFLLVFLFLLADVVSAMASEPARILLVVSSHGRDDGKVQPGFEMDELSQAWLIFRANGLETDIASPEGGAVVADKFDADKDYNRSFLQDRQASEKLDQTLRLSNLDPARYAAIFVIGGKGAMFDLPFSPALVHMVTEIRGRGGVVAAVCHGPAVFARVRDGEGKSFIAGRTLTGFTDEEEALFGKNWSAQYPFLIEAEFRRQGATFTKAAFMLPNVAVDDRIVTGQNPFSVGIAADAVVREMGRTPAAREGWADERSMALVAASLNQGPGYLAAALKLDHATLDPQLIAAWGFYRAQSAAGDRTTIAQGLSVLEAARPWVAEGAPFDKAIARIRTLLEASTSGS